MRQAIVQDATGNVVNVIVVEAKTGWAPPSGHSIVPATADAIPGGQWDGIKFTRPGRVPPDADTMRRQELGQRMLQGTASLVDVQEFLVLRHGIVAPLP